MKKLKFRGAYLFLFAFILISTRCAAPPQRSVSEKTSFAGEDNATHRGKITQAELQDDLLRFESQFNARIQNASQGLETSENPEIRYRAALNRLIYGSNSLNIALGPSPESNLLDMVTFVELSRDVLKGHWIPELFGSAGQSLDQAFLESRQQIWNIAQKVLNVEQRALLQKVISAWRGKHPEQLHVESVRLSAFSNEAGAKAAGLDQDVGGLFASVEQSTQAVDSAKLFAERALYYAERAPFLFRLQARLGAHEIIDDAGVSLAKLSSPLGNERAVSNLLKEVEETLLVTRATLDDAHTTVESVGTLMDQLAQNPRAGDSARATLAQLTDLIKEWNHLLSSPPYQKGLSQMAGIANQVDQESNRLIKKLARLGVGLIACFWIMFVLSKLVHQYLQLKFFGRLKSGNQQDEHKNKAA